MVSMITPLIILDTLCRTDDVARVRAVTRDVCDAEYKKKLSKKKALNFDKSGKFIKEGEV